MGQIATKTSHTEKYTEEVANLFHGSLFGLGSPVGGISDTSKAAAQSRGLKTIRLIVARPVDTGNLLRICSKAVLLLVF